MVEILFECHLFSPYSYSAAAAMAVAAAAAAAAGQGQGPPEVLQFDDDVGLFVIK